MKPNKRRVTDFQESVWEYFRTHPRSMPWREDPSAYNVLVSELMLQQTQVPRVIPKFDEFMTRFPDIKTLGKAPLSDVLVVWNGLGYNRRAKFLHETAKKVVSDYDSKIPSTSSELITLPGVGPNTAGAILAYAHNQPVIFIETNVRTVLFHHFYADNGAKVSDRELIKLAERVFDLEQSREWYWALMDYGTYLKKTAGGRLGSSKHYKKQSPLRGSPREMRGRILKVLTSGPVSEHELQKTVGADERFASALESLASEGMIVKKDGVISLTGH